MFNIAAFQENFEVNGGELKIIVGNDVFRIVVMAKNRLRGHAMIIDVVMPLFDKGDFRTSIKCFGATSSQIRHAS